MLRRIRNKLLSHRGSGAVAFGQKQSNGFRPDRPVSIVMANRFPNAISQVLTYYKSGFLDAKSVPIVFQYFPSSYDNIVQACGAYGIDWFAYGTNADRPKLDSDLILYPFNNPANASCVAECSGRHVLLMHGESNKVALIKPLARLYDHVLVAGDLACERLVEFGIMTLDDIRNGRAIKIGTAAIGELTFFRAAGDGEVGALAYCPTWEGGNAEEDLCSLDWGLPYILHAAKQNSLQHVVLRLHPNTGERLHPLRDAAEQFAQKVLDAGLQLSYAAPVPVTPLEVRLATRFPEIQWLSEEEAIPVALAFTDISALEAMMDVECIPVRVFAERGKTIAAPTSYQDLSVSRFCWKGVRIEDIDLRVSKIDSVTRAYYEKLVGYQSDELGKLPQTERLIWLLNYVKNSPLWTS